MPIARLLQLAIEMQVLNVRSTSTAASPLFRATLKYYAQGRTTSVPAEWHPTLFSVP